MSSEIFYDKAFIRVDDRYIPVVNHGSSNCFDFDSRGREISEKHWSVLNYTRRDSQIFTADEMQHIAEVYEAPVWATVVEPGKAETVPLKRVSLAAGFLPE